MAVSSKKEPIDLERADAIVSELVKSSLYGEGGRKKLYEAVLMVRRWVLCRHLGIYRNSNAVN
jgi:hypothetical protein